MHSPHAAGAGEQAQQRRSPLRLAIERNVREGTGRLEAFSDGVFAIAATLLVIDLRVPADAPTAARLMSALEAQWPTYLSYAASFIYLGIYWAHHVNVFAFFQRTDHVFLKLNVLFLMMIALLPFPTALLGRYGEVPDERRRVATMVYVGSLLVTAALFYVVWAYGTHKRRLVDRELDEGLIARTSRLYLMGPVAYVVAFLLAIWSPLASLVIVALVTLFYLFPLRLAEGD
jgi:uncharacterized membrane protein